MTFVSWAIFFESLYNMSGVTGPGAEGTVHTESGSTPTVVGVKSEMSVITVKFFLFYLFVNTWRIRVAVIAMRMFPELNKIKE